MVKSHRWSGLKSFEHEQNILVLAKIKFGLMCKSKWYEFQKSCLTSTQGLVICFYLDWSGSILQIRTNIIKVGSKSWLLEAVIL